MHAAGGCTPVTGFLAALVLLGFVVLVIGVVYALA